MKFTLFTTGGTIASQKSDRGLAPRLTAQDLLRLCPELMGFEHEIDFVDLMSKDSSNMTPEDWLVMAGAVRARAEACDAAVILHGTDTMAWTAAALSYLLGGLPVPVVLTGSMLSAEEPDSDAPGNIFAAIEFAMQLAMYRRRGVSIAFDGDLIHGPRAEKADSRRRHAFVSVDYPILGEMRDKGTHRIAWLNARAPAITDARPWGDAPAFERDIALLPVLPGMSAKTLDAVIDAGPRAIVLEGYGLGGVWDGLLKAIERGVESGVYFVARTQSLFGGTDLSVYEVGRNLMDMGVISARDMTRPALVTKMMLSLPLCSDRDGLERLLSGNVCDDVLR